MQTSFRKKFIGDRAFYKRVLTVSVPIMLQTGITNFVSLLDNIMVGRLGTEQMSGVAIVNQLFFVYNLCIFGGLAGAGIFTAQYFGSKDEEGIRHTFRYKIWLGFFLLGIAMAAFIFFGKPLISLYLNGSDGNSAATLEYALGYMRIALLGLPAFAVVQIYSNTLRECSETVVPMRAGFVAVFVNLIFNYLLIYGKLGMPRLGVNGAAIATVLSRLTEMAIVVIWTHRHTEKCPYIRHIYRTLLVPGHLVRRFFLTGSPLLVNEALWSAGIAMIAQCYSLRGLNVVAAYNITTTVSNVFNVVFFAMGDAIAIIVGQHLGASDFERAKDEDNKIIALSVTIATLVGIVLFASSPLIPKIYNTSDEVKHIAMRLLMAQAIFTPQIALMHTAYFTLRSGGKTIITFLFDSFAMWVMSIPVAWIFSRFTDLNILWIFSAVQIADWIKCAVGIILVKKNVWIHNIVQQ